MFIREAFNHLVNYGIGFAKIQLYADNILFKELLSLKLLKLWQHNSTK